MDRPKNSISLFWYQRLCEGTIFLGIVLVLLFGFAAFMSKKTLPVGVPIAAMGIALLATITGIVGRLRPPQHLLPAAWGIFVAISTAVFTLVITTGGLQSPFIIIWLLLSLASGIVGLGGILFVLWVNVTYVTLALLLSNAVSSDKLMANFFVSLLPLGVTFLLWRSQIFNDSRRDEQIWHLSERLSREASKSAIIISAIADAVIVISKEGVVQLINPAGQRLTGWEEKEAMHLDYRSVLKLSTIQDQPLQTDDPIQKVFRSGKPDISTDLTLTTKAGKKALLSLVVSPILSEGQVVGVIAVFRDITKEKAEEREKAEFISTASHEMRTPVASIEGYLALAMNPQVAAIDEKARAYLQKAHEATQHLGRLFQDLLTISKAEDGRLANNPQLIEVVSFVQRLWEGQKPKAEAKNLKYFYVPAQGHGSVATKVIRPIFYASMDPDRLSEVVNNLIDNAIKYTAEGEVAVDVTADANNVTISIKDSGIGIAKEDIPHLFQKFYRVDSTYTREVGGTGLGLYISRRIMEQSGGQLRLESEMGKGSTFFVQIPRVDSEKAAFLRQQLSPTTAATAPGLPGATTPTPAPAAPIAPVEIPPEG